VKHGFMALALLGLMLLQPCTALAAPNAMMDAIPGSPPAADFTLPDSTGREHSLSDYRGRVVLVNFWATWCAPCREEMPAMDRLYRALGDHGLEILAVHAGPGGAAMQEFLKRIPVSFTVLVDADLDLRGWQVPALPTTFLVDRQGRTRCRALGARPWDSEAMESFIRGILFPE
jgi:thiol-disulfide isomerase/thioredoxin